MKPTVRLYGTPLSNYYNKVKIALLELNIPFEETILTSLDHWPQSGSPSGKIPFIETPSGFIYESQAIVEYTEETMANASLYPGNPVARAHCRELIQYIELYIELPVRQLYASAFWGARRPEYLAESVLRAVRYGIETLRRRAAFNPWLCGDTFTHADAAAWTHFTTMQKALHTINQDDLLDRELPGFTDYFAHLEQRPSIQRVAHDLRKAWNARVKRNAT